MAGLELRLNTLRRAVAAFAATPGRCGRLVQLDDATEVLVAGDLHGNLDTFRRLMQLADLGKQPRRHLVVQELIHGPFRYPAGGDKSHQLVEVVCALKCQFPRQVHYLIGNHELAQATDRPVFKHETDLNAEFRRGIELAYGSHAAGAYDVVMRLFAVIPFAVRTAGRLFLSHSLPGAGPLADFSLAALRAEPTDEADLSPGRPLYALVWGRDTRGETLDRFLAAVEADALVSGHIPCPERGFERPNPRHLILDSQGSPAACARLPADRPLLPEDLDAGIHLL